ncbi:hypothetical protein [Fusibacter bizertensis]
MQVFVFSDDEEKSKLEMMGKLHQYIFIKSKPEIDSQFNIYEQPILIVMSQPSKQFELALSNYKWHKILSHKGVRINESIINVFAYFETNLELIQEIDKAATTQRLAIRQQYMNDLGILEEEDYQYLKKLAGEEIEVASQRIKRKSSRRNKTENTVDFTGVITVVNTVETAIALAEAISANINGAVLIFDGDFLMPCLDEKLRLRKIHTQIKSHVTGIDNTGVNIALDTMAKGLNLEEYIDSIVVKKSRKEHVLLGNYNLFNYEHYDDTALKKLLLKLKDIYQIVIVCVPLFPYDAMTMLSLHVSQINIFGIEKTMSATRYLYQYIKLLNTKQGLAVSKNLVITKDQLNKSQRIGNLVMREVFGESYLGSQLEKKNKLLKKVIERMR